MMYVYREGLRIRDENGVGYSDRVSDEQIMEHIYKDIGADHDAINFAISVIALRKRERRDRAKLANTA